MGTDAQTVSSTAPGPASVRNARACVRACGGWGCFRARQDWGGGVLAAQVLAADTRLCDALQIMKLGFSLAHESFMGEAKIPYDFGVRQRG